VADAVAAGVDALHLDVMDGAFVPNITFGADTLRAVRAVTALPIEVHLMVQAPERFLEQFASAGASILTVHYEATPHAHRALSAVRDLGLRAGLALNPGTPALLAQDLVPALDLLLVMTVNPGFGGQRFIPTMLPKLRAARRLLDEVGSAAELEVDGGVDPVNAPAAVEAGATSLVAGSSIFGSGDVARAVWALRAAGAGSAGLWADRAGGRGAPPPGLDYASVRRRRASEWCGCRRCRPARGWACRPGGPWSSAR
jgi:ribulose-phosphate 3-epimerase